MINIKSFQWVLENLNNPDVRIMDCRFQLNDPKVGELAYKQGHLPNAFYLDLNKDLSSEIQEHGGRHPLPDLQKLCDKLSDLGVDETVTVVAYDDQSGAMASRLWWLLKYLGHDKVYVLNGNFNTWKEKGYPIDTSDSTVPRKEFYPSIQHHLVATVEDVRAKLKSQATTIIDSREPNRYLGIEEPIDKKAGHIPGALNYFWQESLENGLWKGQERLKERFHKIPVEKEVIVYCGSGVTACPNILSLTEAGYKNVKLYAGSWSDWISYPDNPISTK